MLNLPISHVWLGLVMYVCVCASGFLLNQYTDQASWLAPPAECLSSFSNTDLFVNVVDNFLAPPAELSVCPSIQGSRAIFFCLKLPLIHLY